MFQYKPPEIERKIGVARPRPVNRAADKTLATLAQGWMPVNPQLLNEIQAKLKDGAYRRDRELLVGDIKQDPGLFVQSVRKMAQLPEVPAGDLNPLQVLRSLEDEKLTLLLGTPESQLSPHRFHDLSKSQALRAQQTLLNTQAAQAIAGKVQVSADDAFTAATFRELGLSLIAWNYPSIYARALGTFRTKGSSIDTQLKTMLGLSPAEIGLKFANDGGLSSGIKAALKNAASGAMPSGEPASGAMALPWVCDAAELFAQSRDPDHYPQAREQWEQARSKMPVAFDDSLVQQVEANVAEALSHSYSKTPSVFVSTFAKQHCDQPETEASERVVHSNGYVLRCPEHIRASFEEVYRNLELGKISLDAVRLLVDTVVPKTGFVRGCLFLLDQNNGKLKPALRIGDRVLDAYAAMSDTNGVIESSLYSSVPFKKFGYGLDGEETAYICGSINNKAYPGVLFMELTAKASADPEHDALLYFHAVRATINDCLGAR